MPLINLTTDLKALRYGGDQPGGGSSGLPYVVSPRPDEISPQQPIRVNGSLFTDYYALNRETRDFPIRGGSLQLDGATGLTTTPSGLIDRFRIESFLKDPARGAIFLKKQVGLQLTNPKTQVEGIFQGRRLGVLEGTRVYNPTGITTLLQTVTQGTGTHIPRHGIIPNIAEFKTLGYEQFVRINNTEEGNRLILLRSTKLLSDTFATTAYAGRAFDYGISILNSQILNYEGGPGSTYGIGTTVVNRATNTNISKVYNSIAFNYDTIANQATTDGYSRAHPIVQDFREGVNKQVDTTVQPTADYYSDRIETRLQLGNPGSLQTRTNYSASLQGTQDRLNTLEPFIYNPSEKPWEARIGGTSQPPKDMVKFVFECLSNDSTDLATALIFRSFLTGITDNHQAEFNSFKYLGRGETFRTYQGFDRSVSFSFKIAAFTRNEMRPLYTKLNTLISQVYPDYSPTTRFMRGNVVRLTIGDYLYRVPGFLENVNITIDDNVAWEIALNDPDMRELPQVISVQCTFKPIHDILPRRVTIDNPNVPLIVNTEASYVSSLIDALPLKPIPIRAPGVPQIVPLQIPAPPPPPFIR